MTVPTGVVSPRVPIAGMRQHVKVVTIPKVARLIEEQQPISEERMPLTPEVRAAYECGHCLSDVIIPRVIRLHDQTRRVRR